MGFVIEPEARVTLPVVGTGDVFPVGTVYCIGLNYADHTREMGKDPQADPPCFFLKATSCVHAGPTLVYPRNSTDVHFEVELVAALGGGGREVPVAEALGLVYGYAVGLDMTRRDRQGEAKKAGRPWDIGKTFPGAAPCSPIAPAAGFDSPLRGAITLDLNGARRQDGRLEDMIWSLPEQISILSHSFDLKPGDLIFTGTPSGVGPVARGDRLVAAVEGVGRLEVEVV